MLIEPHLSARQKRTTTFPDRDDAANSVYAAQVRSVAPCNGRGAVSRVPGSRRRHGALDQSDRLDAIHDQIDRLKAETRAKVKHPFPIIKRQFGYARARYMGLVKKCCPDDAVCSERFMDVAQSFAKR
ncbi:hypothetical protein QFZ91_005583 [Paraburkholderia sp. JPY419]